MKWSLDREKTLQSLFLSLLLSNFATLSHYLNPSFFFMLFLALYPLFSMDGVKGDLNMKNHKRRSIASWVILDW